MFPDEEEQESRTHGVDSRRKLTTRVGGVYSPTNINTTGREPIQVCSFLVELSPAAMVGRDRRALDVMYRAKGQPATGHGFGRWSRSCRMKASTNPRLL
jgi:hypothetical protein